MAALEDLQPPATGAAGAGHPEPAEPAPVPVECESRLHDPESNAPTAPLTNADAYAVGVGIAVLSPTVAAPEDLQPPAIDAIGAGLVGDQPAPRPVCTPTPAAACSDTISQSAPECYRR